MDLLAHIRQTAMSRDGRRRFIDQALKSRYAELQHGGFVVVSHGADDEYIRTGRSLLPAWLVFYDADPQLQGSIRLELESFRAGRGFGDELAYSNLTEDDEPSRHLFIADLHVDDRRRGRSIGSRLIDAAKAIAADRKLELRGKLSDVDDVPRLVSFYRSRGFLTEMYEVPSGPMVGEVWWAATPPALPAGDAIAMDGRPNE